MTFVKGADNVLYLTQSRSKVVSVEWDVSVCSGLQSASEVDRGEHPNKDSLSDS
jgi:hypothetical protein